jgi:cation diffusion facilitator family transporter
VASRRVVTGRVARYRIRTGRHIGSAALVADGLHARTDGFTSLAVVLGAGGVAAGWQLADPIVGLLITVAIVVVLREAAREVCRRLTDAVDPALLTQAELALAEVPGVVEVGWLRLRWVGHQLHAPWRPCPAPRSHAGPSPPGDRCRRAAPHQGNSPLDRRSHPP